MITREQLRKSQEDYYFKSGKSIRQLAKEFGIDAGHYHRFLHGKVPAPSKVLKKLGFEEIPMYRKVDRKTNNG